MADITSLARVWPLRAAGLQTLQTAHPRPSQVVPAGISAGGQLRRVRVCFLAVAAHTDALTAWGRMQRGRRFRLPPLCCCCALFQYLTEYLVTTTAALVLQSLWTTRKQWTAGNVFFRTPAAPVAVQGITLNLSDAQGNVLTLTPDLEGYFNTAQSRGRIDYQAGLTEIQFGAFVEAAALTAAERAEWWFDAADVGAVQAGKVWKPLPVDPTTLRFNSVTYVFLPLDADIIGMDPVRLPSDGRVPVYRNGYYVVVGHTAVLPAATLGAGQSIDCARTRLSRVWIVGADGQKIQTGWSVDLDAGLLSIADVTGWAQPVPPVCPLRWCFAAPAKRQTHNPARTTSSPYCLPICKFTNSRHICCPAWNPWF